MPSVARSTIPHSRPKWEKFYTRFLLARTCYAARSHVLARLASLAQIGELARRLKRRKNHTLWGGTYLGLFTSCSATFWQLLVFRATFFVWSKFFHSEQFLQLSSNSKILEQLLAREISCFQCLNWPFFHISQWFSGQFYKFPLKRSQIPHPPFHWRRSCDAR